MKTRSSKNTLVKSIVKGGLTLIPAALLILSTSCTTVAPPPPGDSNTSTAIQEGVPGGVVVNTVDVSARVTAIDKANRKVTLLGPDGDTFTVKVGPEAVNFDQVKVGDLLKVTVTEEVVIYLEKEGAASSDGGAGVGVVALAPKGAKPGGLMAQTIQVTGTVVAIDQEKRIVTLRFADGTFKAFSVREDIDLTQHKKGEQVVFQVTEMVAISVEKE
jgi:hypothetical protein